MGARVSSITVDMSGAGRKIDALRSNKRLGEFMASEAQRGMEPYVPMRTGALVASAKSSPFEVEYTASYATYPYHGRNMTIRTEMHPLATKEWDKAYASAHGEELGRAATSFVKGL